MTDTERGRVALGLYFDARDPLEWRRGHASVYSQLLETVEEAERRGIDYVWMSEHHFFEDGYLPQPLILASAIAARTKRVRIGTAALLAPLRHPLHIAEAAAIVDIISDGRLEIGLGAGYRLPEFEAFDVDPAMRFELTERRLQEIREIWSTGRALPPPIQDPLPIWLAYLSISGAYRAGRSGVSLLNGLIPEAVGEYRRGLRDGGWDNSIGRIAGLFNVVISDDPETTWDRLMPHVLYQSNSYSQSALDGTGLPRPPLLTAQDIRRPIELERAGDIPAFAILEPADAAGRINAIAASNPYLSEVHAWADVGGMPRDIAERHVELWCTVVRDLVS